MTMFVSHSSATPPAASSTATEMPVLDAAACEMLRLCHAPGGPIDFPPKGASSPAIQAWLAAMNQLSWKERFVIKGQIRNQLLANAHAGGLAPGNPAFWEALKQPVASYCQLLQECLQQLEQEKDTYPDESYQQLHNNLALVLAQFQAHQVR